jgi:phage-related minor tail protein
VGVFYILAKVGKKMNNEVVVGLVSSVPVSGLLLFFLYRHIKKRDAFEKKAEDFFVEMKGAFGSLDKALAVMAKDIEHAINLSKTVGDLTERVGKLKYDIDNYFAKVREMEKRM